MLETDLGKVMMVNLTGGPGADLGIDLDVASRDRRARVLVVDDALDIVSQFKQILRNAGMNVLSAANGEEALQKVGDLQPDLVLLDMIMPGEDALGLIAHFRRRSNIPIIALYDETEMDRGREAVVWALMNGADDCLIKPVYPPELAARVSAVLRRSGNIEEVSRFIFPEAGLTIDLLRQEVFLKDREIQFTAREFSILTLLTRRAPAIVGYDVIARSVWGEDSEDVRKRIKYLVYLVRRKLEDVAPGSDLIINIDRLGYKLNV